MLPVIVLFFVFATMAGISVVLWRNARSRRLPR
jgi:hypothetical protein